MNKEKLYELNDELCEASYDGDFNTIKKVISKGAQIHFANNFPLRVACKQNHLEIVQYFLDNGADVHAHKDEALVSSSSLGFVDIVKLLLSHTKFNSKTLENALKNSVHDSVKNLLNKAQIHQLPDRLMEKNKTV